MPIWQMLLTRAGRLDVDDDEIGFFQPGNVLKGIR